MASSYSFGIFKIFLHLPLKIIFSDVCIYLYKCLYLYVKTSLINFTFTCKIMFNKVYIYLYKCLYLHVKTTLIKFTFNCKIHVW